MRRFAVICMCAVAIAGAVPSVPAFAATGNVVMAAVPVRPSGYGPGGADCISKQRYGEAGRFM